MAASAVHAAAPMPAPWHGDRLGGGAAAAAGCGFHGVGAAVVGGLAGADHPMRWGTKSEWSSPPVDTPGLPAYRPRCTPFLLSHMAAPGHVKGTVMLACGTVEALQGGPWGMPAGAKAAAATKELLPLALDVLALVAPGAELCATR